MQTVTFQAETAHQLRTQINDYCREFNVVSDVMHTLKPTTQPAIPSPQAAPPAEKKGRGRPVKAKTETSFTDEEPSEEASPAEEIEAPAKVAITKEQATEKLTKLNAAKGLPTAIAVLAKFGVQRVSLLPAEKYAEFITACDAAMLQ